MVEDLVVMDRVSIEFPGTRGRADVLAVSDVSVSIRGGEKFVLLGPSGCGKSTLLTAIGGFIPVSSGEIRVHGKAVTGPSMNRVLVFQDFGQLLPWRTVAANVEWAVGKRWPEKTPPSAATARCSTSSWWGSVPRRSSTPTPSRVGRSSAAPSRAPSRCNPRCC
jgi:ABC-type taurine transport system ATPase subunit